MTRPLFSLRDVPEDEADEVRALLDANAIDYRETPPGPFGLTAGALWVDDAERFAAARRLIDDYQARRAERARSERAAAIREGRMPGFWSVLRAQPLRVLLVLIGVAMTLGLMLLPFALLGR